MAVNIKTNTGEDLFKELSSVEKVKTLYVEYVKQSTELGVPMKKAGREMLSMVINNKISDDLAVADVLGLKPEKDESSESNEEDGKEIVGGEVPDGMSFDEYKEYIVKNITGSLKNPYDELASSSYDNLFVAYNAPAKGRSFFQEVRDTKNIEELNKLYDDLIIDVQKNKIMETGQKLKNDEEKVKREFLRDFKAEMPEPNVFKYIKDIEDGKDVYTDKRKHKFLDMTGILSSSYVVSASSLISTNETICSAVVSRYQEDVGKIGKILIEELGETPFNKFDELSNSQMVIALANTMKIAKENDVDTVFIFTINSVLTDGVNDELRDELIAEANSLKTLNEALKYRDKLIKELTPYLQGRSSSLELEPSNKDE